MLTHTELSFRLADVGKKFIEITSAPEMPRELDLSLVLSYGPTGHPGAVISAMYNGAPDQGKEVIKPITDLGPIMQHVCAIRIPFD